MQAKHRPEPVISRTFFTATEDLSPFFSEDNPLPVFLGSSADEHLAVLCALDRKDKWTGWRRAAIAASLLRERGQRTGEETVIQRFCRLQKEKGGPAYGPSYISRLSKTYRLFSDIFATGCKTSLPELMEDDRLTFKHFIIAAVSTSLPVVNLLEARDEHWSADEFQRRIAARRQRVILDEVTGLAQEPENDDNELENAGASISIERPRAPKPIIILRQVFRSLMPSKTYRLVAQNMQEISEEFGTQSDIDTMVAAIQFTADRIGAKTQAAEIEPDGSRAEQKLPRLVPVMAKAEIPPSREKRRNAS